MINTSHSIFLTEEQNSEIICILQLTIFSEQLSVKSCNNHMTCITSVCSSMCFDFVSNVKNVNIIKCVWGAHIQ